MQTKTIVLVTAPETFRDEEYAIPKKIFENAGVKTVTASLITGKITGRFGLVTLSDTTIDAVSPDGADGVIFVGGGGASVYFENETALNIARTFYKAGKIAAAICIAPVILAYSGVLNGKRVTVFPDGIEILQARGALYENRPVVVDGNIITGRDYLSAQEFAETILSKL
jgi:protease I